VEVTVARCLAQTQRSPLARQTTPPGIAPHTNSNTLRSPADSPALLALDRPTQSRICPQHQISRPVGSARMGQKSPSDLLLNPAKARHSQQSPLVRPLAREREGRMSTYRVITIDYDGREVRGSFSVWGRTITVETAHGSKTTQLGGPAVKAEALARIMLRELAQEGKA
jgi:hypothetical protein